MAKTEKVEAAKIARTWRHSVQRIEDNEGARLELSIRARPRNKSNAAIMTGMYAGPGWRKVPKGSWRLSQITKSENKASAVPDTLSVVNSVTFVLFVLVYLKVFVPRVDF